MLIAVGMYLPFQSTAAIFVGGIIKWLFDLRLKRMRAGEDERQRAENTGVLLASGFIAGESLMAVLLALLVIAGDVAPWLLGFQKLAFGAEPRFWLSLLVYPVVIYLLVWVTVSSMRKSGLPAAKITE
jgi:membrane protein YqaA with SNARE-associated domain